MLGIYVRATLEIRQAIAHPLVWGSFDSSTCPNPPMGNLIHLLRRVEAGILNADQFTQLTHLTQQGRTACSPSEEFPFILNRLQNPHWLASSMH